MLHLVRLLGTGLALGLLPGTALATPDAELAVSPVPDAPAIAPQQMASADLDGDGRAELIGVAPDGSGLLVAHADGAAALALPVSAMTQQVVAADVDGDMDIDLVAADSSGVLTTLLNDGDGAFPVVAGPTPTTGPIRDLLVADVDADGTADTIALHTASRTVELLRGDASGTFVSTLQLPVGSAARELATADIDGSGTPDLAIVGARPGRNVDIFLAQPDGTWVPTGASAPGRPETIAIGDVTGDGTADLVTAGDTLGVLNGASEPPFAPSPVTIPNATDVVLADVGGDAGVEMVAVVADSVMIVRAPGGAPSEVSSTPLPASATAAALTTADIDGDGRLDVAIAPATAARPTVLANVNEAPQVFADATVVPGRDALRISFRIDTQGHSTSFRIDYGLSTDHDSETAPVAVDAPAGVRVVEATIGGLLPGRFYRYRVIATNAFGMARGAPGERSTLLAPPEVVRPPAIVGSMRVGALVTCDSGDWRGGPLLQVDWVRSDGAVVGSGAVLRLRAILAGAPVSCRVRASNSAGTIDVLSPARRVLRARRCRVPAVVGQRFTAARTRLLRAGCRLGAVERVPARPADVGRVLAVRPRAGRMLAFRSRVRIVVGVARRS